MKLFVAIFLATLSLVAAQSSSDDWKCGNGPVTSRTSFLLAGHFAKSDGMNCYLSNEVWGEIKCTRVTVSFKG